MKVWLKKAIFIQKIKFWNSYLL